MDFLSVEECSEFRLLTQKELNILELLDHSDERSAEAVFKEDLERRFEDFQERSDAAGGRSFEVGDTLLSHALLATASIRDEPSGFKALGSLPFLKWKVDILSDFGKMALRVVLDHVQRC